MIFHFAFVMNFDSAKVHLLIEFLRNNSPKLITPNPINPNLCTIALIILKVFKMLGFICVSKNREAPHKESKDGHRRKVPKPKPNKYFPASRPKSETNHRKIK